MVARRRRLLIWLVPLAIVALCCALSLYSEWIALRVARLHPPQGNFLAIEGGRLHYVERRPGGPSRGTVVLVHGASSDHADLMAVLGAELSHYRVLAFDRPGSGWSDRLDGAAMADPARQADVLMQALDRIAPERFVLVAHSLAGALSVRIALERPERLRGLALLAGVTHPWPGGIAWYHGPASWTWAAPLFSRVVGVPAASVLLDAGARSVFDPAPVTAGYLDTGEIRLLLRPAAFTANSQDIAALFDFVTAQAPRYASLAVPVVAITGDSDTIVSPLIHASAIAREAPQGRLVLLPRVGHMPHHAAPDIVAGVIDELSEAHSDLALQ